MLRNLSPLLGPDVLWMLAAMGHGDRLAVVDRNYPLHGNHQRLVRLDGTSLAPVMKAIASVLPVDDFIAEPVHGMVSETEPDLAIESHGEVGAILGAAEGRAISVTPLPRTAFYEEARGAFGAILTSETRPFSCFLITKGVVRATVT